MLTTLARAVIQTIFFVSGIVTLVQTFVGDRLPIIQARPSLKMPTHGPSRVKSVYRSLVAVCGGTHG